ncbi:MAG: hypothetical protein NTY09_01425 [bacterium]|nr:hypothetical protein [bacterium]
MIIERHFPFVVIIFLLMVVMCVSANAEEGIAPQEPIGSSASQAQEESAPQEEQPEQVDLTLPAITPLSVVLLEELYSQRNQEGDEIIMAIANDVVVDGVVYLVAGTPVIGRVTSTRPARSWGSEGQLDVEIMNVDPPYGSPIPVSGSSSLHGSDTATAAYITDVLLGTTLGPIIGGSMEGHGAVIPAGTTVTVFTAQEATISNLPSDEMNALVDDWYNNEVISSFLAYSPVGLINIYNAITSLGYTVDTSKITVQPAENYMYTVDIEVAPGQIASFTFQPFQEIRAWKFSTMVPNNDLADTIFRSIR